MLTIYESLTKITTMKANLSIIPNDAGNIVVMLLALRPVPGKTSSITCISTLANLEDDISNLVTLFERKCR